MRSFSEASNLVGYLPVGWVEPRNPTIPALDIGGVGFHSSTQPTNFS
jgi:hypothetical protein